MISENMEAQTLPMYHLAVDLYALISLSKTQLSSESTDFLSSVSYSSKLNPRRVS